MEQWKKYFRAKSSCLNYARHANTPIRQYSKTKLSEEPVVRNPNQGLGFHDGNKKCLQIQLICYGKKSAGSSSAERVC
jgi:hypothetical protein